MLLIMEGLGHPQLPAKQLLTAEHTVSGGDYERATAFQSLSCAVEFRPIHECLNSSPLDRTVLSKKSGLGLAWKDRLHHEKQCM